MLYVLIIVSSLYGYGTTSSTVTGYPTRESCLESVRFVKNQPHTVDAYCVAVPKEAK